MSLLGGSVLTLADHAKRLDPDGKTATIVELLAQQNGILNDMLFMEGNLVTGHRTTVRTGLPTPVWRVLNQGVAKSKSTTAQIDEACAMLEARSELDVDLASLGGDLGAMRLSEAKPFLEAMNQEMASTIFYGNSTSAPEEFMGLASRYSSLSAANGQNIVNGGGVGADNSSIWLTVWGDQSIHGIFPKGSKAGLIHEDLGMGDAFDSSNNRFRAYMDRWQWKSGIALRDWRQVVRIANIDISVLVANSSPANLTHLMIRALHRVFNISAGKPVFYMNRTCFQQLDIQRFDNVQDGGQLSYDVVDGKRIPYFRGIPVVVVDSLLETEAVVS